MFSLSPLSVLRLYSIDDRMINEHGEIGGMRKYIMGAIIKRILCTGLSEWELERVVFCIKK